MERKRSLFRISLWPVKQTVFSLFNKLPPFFELIDVYIIRLILHFVY